MTKTPDDAGRMHLTRAEQAALRLLVDDLIAATDNHTFWFGRVRETALELRAKLDGWLADDGE